MNWLECPAALVPPSLWRIDYIGGGLHDARLPSYGYRWVVVTDDFGNLVEVDPTQSIICLDD